MAPHCKVKSCRLPAAGLNNYDNVDERLSLLLLEHKNMRGTAVVLSQGFRLPICVFVYLIQFIRSWHGKSV